MPPGVKRATATPNVISISGIAICPISSIVFVRKVGVCQSCHKNKPPSSVAQTSGSRSTLPKLPAPATSQIPKVKVQIAMIAKTTTA